jgi:hypothetical protein
MTTARRALVTQYLVLDIAYLASVYLNSVLNQPPCGTQLHESIATQ